jgi:L-ascorbate metabolism protein UlaG (beta-lactamase superfamily)
MRVTSLGHAALYVETEDHRILIDPIFSETVADGAVRYNPERKLDLKKLPAPTALFLTGSDFGRFHLPTLQRLQKDLPVFHPESSMLRRELESAGFSRIATCAPWQEIELGQTRLIATPSTDQEPKVGVAIYGGGSFWNMADADAIRTYGARLARRHGRIDVVAAKYQPSEQAAMNYSDGRGTRFDKALVASWLEAACAARPAFVFPCGSGLCFSGHFSWLNRLLFPFSPEEIAELLRRRPGVDRVEVVNPGDVVEITADKPPVRISQGSPFVSMGSALPQIWEPVETSTLARLDHPAEHRELETLLDRFLAERLVPWLGKELKTPASPWEQHRINRVVWQLVVETGDSERIERFIECEADHVAAVPGRYRFANSFTHLSGKTLLDVLRGKMPGTFLCLAGQTRSYEKTIGVVNGRLAAADEITDPMTYFLRHFNVDGNSITDVKPTPALGKPSEIELLHRHETTAVLKKKILLSILALREASQLGIAITEAEVQSLSDWLRQRFGLESAEDMRVWLDEVGLDMDGFSRVMYSFAAVSRIQAHWTEEIESLVGIYAKVASIRSGDQ